MRCQRHPAQRPTHASASGEQHIEIETDFLARFEEDGSTAADLHSRLRLLGQAIVPPARTAPTPAYRILRYATLSLSLLLPLHEHGNQSREAQSISAGSAHIHLYRGAS